MRFHYVFCFGNFVSSSHLHAATIASPITSSASSPPPAPDPPLRPRIELILHFAFLFLSAWQARNRVSSTAMTELLQAIGLIFEWALVAGIGAIVNVPGEVPWSGDQSMDGKMPHFDRTKKTKRSRLVKASLFTITTIDDSNQTFTYNSSMWPSTIEKASKPLKINTLQFDTRLLCPDVDCGGNYLLSDIDTMSDLQTANPKCTRVAAVAAEQPAHAMANAESMAIHDDANVARCGTPLLKYQNKHHIDDGGAANIHSSSASSSAPIRQHVRNPHTHTPQQLYPYTGIRRPIIDQLQRPGVEMGGEKWREGYEIVNNTMRRRQSHTLGDVSHGAHWERNLYYDKSTGKTWSKSTPGDDPPSAPDFDRRMDGLAAPGTIALAINVDWFSPNKDQMYSVGGIYGTNLNLPRGERYLPKNMILIGVLPGPSQTSKVQLQAAVRTAVAELLVIFESMRCGVGEKVRTFEHPDGVLLRVVLLCVICDTPAARKMGGTAGHSADAGCPWCTAGGTGGGRGAHWSFAQTGSRDTWELKTDQSHRQHADEWCAAARDQKSANKKTDKSRKLTQDEHWQKHGTRYCALMDLPYFDMVRGIPLDVMHNIYLGLCKESMSLLTRPTPRCSTAILSSSDLRDIQSFMRRCSPPSDIGDIPIKIASRFSKFKAAEWKNWTTMFCVPALRWFAKQKRARSGGQPPRLMPAHIAMMMTIQQVAVILQQNVITTAEIDRVDQLLAQVMRQVEDLFSSRGEDDRANDDGLQDEEEGAEEDEERDYSLVRIKHIVKPNLHFSQHLGPMLHDFGAPIEWWCNPYERFNGLIANVPRNQSYIELCTMRRFLLLHNVGRIVDEHTHDSRRTTMHRSFVPCVSDYELVSHMLIGSTNHMVGVGSNGLKAAVRVTANSRSTMVYEWNAKTREIDYQAFRDMRHGKLIERKNNRGETCYQMMKVYGHELFPFRFLGESVRARLDGVGGRSSGYSQCQPLMSSNHMMDVLRTQYALIYRESEIRAHAKSNPILRQEIKSMETSERDAWLQVQSADMQAQGADQQRRLWKSSQREKYRELQLPAQIDWLTSRYIYAINDIIYVSKAVEIAGETFGSVLSPRNVRSSYVIINFHHQNTPVITPYYAQVQFYFTHQFMNKKHQFAAVRYFERFGTSKDAKRSDRVVDHLENNDDRANEDANVKDQLLAANTWFAVLERTPMKASVDDVVPIMRLSHRFIPVDIDIDRKEAWIVIPIATKEHM